MDGTATDERRPGRRVLIIAYYFPPMGFSGVQRVTKFAKYLPGYGWMPTVLTVHPGGYFAYDPTLLEELEEHPVEIVRTASIDPTRIFGKKRSLSFPDESSRRRISGLSQWLFIPDNKIGWLPFALAKGSSILRSRSYDAILSSAPPYTCHLIGSVLSRQFDIPLVFDYRDDWLDNPRHVYPTKLHTRLHREMERRAASRTSSVFTINHVIAETLEQRLGRAIEVIGQGFDPEDFKTWIEPDRTVFRLTYTGVFYDEQKPDVFLEACALFLRNRPEAKRHLRLDFAGTLPNEAIELARRLNIDECLTHHGYLSHLETVRLQMRSSVLWMTIGKRRGAESISTGKLFEYIGAQRPILALIPEGAAADVIAAYNMATIVPPDDPQLVSKSIDRLYTKWLDDSFPEADRSFVQKFDRLELTRTLADILNDISSGSV